MKILVWQYSWGDEWAVQVYDEVVSTYPTKEEATAIALLIKRAITIALREGVEVRIIEES